jgi:hypothetical protein
MAMVSYTVVFKGANIEKVIVKAIHSSTGLLQQIYSAHFGFTLLLKVLGRRMSKYLRAYRFWIGYVSFLIRALSLGDDLPLAN